MRSIPRRRPSAAMVVALLALFIALGGLSWAAVTLAPNSVGTKQLKKKAVTGPKIKRNAVTSAKVKNGSLQRADFASGTLLQGSEGPIGLQGPKGDPGQNGAPGVARAYARVLISLGEPHVIPQLSHNALGVRRAPGDPAGHFCVEVQGVPTVEIRRAFRSSRRRRLRARTGLRVCRGVSDGDDTKEVEIKTLDATGAPRRLALFARRAVSVPS